MLLPRRKQQPRAGDALPLNFSETELWPRRFVFPTSGNATLATEYVTRYMAGSLQNTASSRSDGNCVKVSRGEWSGPESSFDMEWVQQRSVAHGSMIVHWETHVQQMHGNLTRRSATNWDHYMDYKAGLLFDDLASSSCNSSIKTRCPTSSFLTRASSVCTHRCLAALWSRRSVPPHPKAT